MWKTYPRNNLHWNKFENECFRELVVVGRIVHSNHVLHSHQHFLALNRFKDKVIDGWDSYVVDIPFHSRKRIM